MRMLACVSWTVLLVLLAVPWVAATLLAWVYAEVFHSPNDPPQLTLEQIFATLQSVSGILYLLYIPAALLCVGLVGRRSTFSYCCLVLGLPVFVAVPAVAGVGILVVTLTNQQASVMTEAGRVGIASGVCCLLSTVTCFFLLVWSMACGSKGRGRRHQYPTPLAYFPVLRDCHEIERREEVADSDRYTADYPPPRYTFPERKPLSISVTPSNTPTKN